jgi:membrane-anchored protein YejM (alkaline phosphatase superfamily)
MLFTLIYQAGIYSDLLSSFYAITIPFYYYFIVIILSIPFLIFIRSKSLSYLVVIPKVLFDFLLIINLLIFNIYQFHLDLMFINMAIHDFEGMGIPLHYVFMLFIIFLIILFGNILLLKSTKKKFTFMSIFIPFLILISGQLIHVYGDYFKKNNIIKYTPYVPYYLPLTSSTIMSNYFERVIEKPSVFKKNDGILNYPLQKLEFSQNAPKPNILFIVLESWRWDMLNKDIAPNMFAYSKGAYNFNDHYSNGTATVPGMYSLMYGIFPSYLSFTQAKPYKFQSAFTKTLKNYGYDIESYSTSNFNRFALKEMFFGDIADDKFHDKHDDKYMASIFNTDGKKPWFKLIFFVNSHFDYNYPKEYTKFKPVPKITENFALNKNINPTPFLNDYKNSIYYTDTLFAQIMAKVKDKNTIVIVTADHGEEFNDNKQGYWTHGNNFTKYQFKVPLIVKLPNQTQPKEIHHKTSHVDIIPTIFEYMKIKNKRLDYSSGENLFSDTNRLLVIQSYRGKAYFIKNTIYTMGIKFDSYDVNDIKIKNDKYYFKEIEQIRKKERVFLKH